MRYLGTLTPEKAEKLGVPSSVLVISPANGRKSNASTCSVIKKLKKPQVSFVPKPAGERVMQNLHIVLLGDSIFDNQAYVPEGPAVIDHLRALIPTGWKASLAAQDGDVVADVIGQFLGVPDDATHLVVSAGGNDALNALGLLSEPASSVFDGLNTLADIRNDFRSGYRAMLRHLKSLQLPLTVCTIYDSVPGLGRQEKAALALFNEIILREAFEAGLPVIDLRIVCQEESDYSVISPIEPSNTGGAKIARVIAEMLEYGSSHSLIYA